MPARYLLKCVKGHAGYFGCDKCKQEGSWHGKMTFPETNAPLRTDMRFHEMTNAKHHLCLSTPFKFIAINNSLDRNGF